MKKMRLLTSHTRQPRHYEQLFKISAQPGCSICPIHEEPDPSVVWVICRMRLPAYAGGIQRNKVDIHSGSYSTTLLDDGQMQNGSSQNVGPLLVEEA